MQWSEWNLRWNSGVTFIIIGLGEQPDDLQPFDAEKFAEALFAE